MIAGCDDLYKHSVISWCDYIDHEPDTTFAFGFHSLIHVYGKLLKSVSIKIIRIEHIGRRGIKSLRG